MTNIKRFLSDDPRNNHAAERGSEPAKRKIKVIFPPEDELDYWRWRRERIARR